MTFVTIVAAAAFLSSAPSHQHHCSQLYQQQQQQQPYTDFLHQVETSIQNVFADHDDPLNVDILSLPTKQREPLGVARALQARLDGFSRSQDCRRCWLQRAHCICDDCPPLEGHGRKDEHDARIGVGRLFLLTHHKEICLTVDTAKLILAAFPQSCRLVVGGIGPDYQASMAEMMDCIGNNQPFVLFPSDDAQTLRSLLDDDNDESPTTNQHSSTQPSLSDVIVIDGTWSQARKLHSRYISNNPHSTARHVELSQEAVAHLDGQSNENDSNTVALSGTKQRGHQLRRHPIKWREISTLEATRLFLRDVYIEQTRHERPSQQEPTLSPLHHDLGDDHAEPDWLEKLALYQEIADAAAKKQLGPVRLKMNATVKQ